MLEAEPVRTPVKIEAAGDTHIGGRTHNEDSILMRADLNLYLVADGAGGQNAGNVASSLAVTSIAHFFEQTDKTADERPALDGLGLPTAARRLSAAVHEANAEILDIAKGSDKHRGMGTTVVAALVDAHHRALHIAYVGDSRCYRVRGGGVELLTFDHSLINDVLELRPNIDDERVKKLPQNVITRALGMSDNLRVSMRSHQLLHGDRYVLCSDGLSDVVSDAQIAQALRRSASCSEHVATLVGLAVDAGASDNVAVVLIKCSLPAATSNRPPRRAKRKRSPNLQPKTQSEDAPEIVLYDRVPLDPESDPSVHVVPLVGSADAVVDAVQDVMARDDRTKPKATAPRDPASQRQTSSPPLETSVDKPDVELIDMPAPSPSASGAPAVGLSAPRVDKPDVGRHANEPRSGHTQQPPSTTRPLIHDSPTLVHPMRKPAIPPPSWGLSPGPPPGPPSSRASPLSREPDSDSQGPGTLPGVPVDNIKPPAMREPFSTSEFTGGDDSVACHACGSVISERAEICMYCGATTGFVLKP